MKLICSTPLINIYGLLIIITASTSCASTRNNQNNDLIIKEQGAFSAGGNVVKSEGEFDALKLWNVQQGGQTRHGDHADVFYQLPVNAKKYSMVFLHGYGQSRRSWQTTADGRTGFADIFLRKGYGVYLVDQPGRGQRDKLRNQDKLPHYPTTKRGSRNFALACIRISMMAYSFRKILHRWTSFTG